MGRIRVGTSGYQYRHWRSLLYPAGLPVADWLQHYASIFDTCELNATFYRLPTARAVDGWRERTPPGFLFSCKGSRYLTHLKRLADAGEGVRRYFELVSRLGAKLGPVLWQLPPQMRPDHARLDSFLGALPREVRHAVEFRNADWYTAETCAVLDAHGAAFCEHDLVARPPPHPTGAFRYLRFHGATGKYQGRYGRRALRPVARDLTRYAPRGDAFAYFNNDVHGHAVQDALELLELLREEGAPLGAGEAPAAPQAAAHRG